MIRIEIKRSLVKLYRTEYTPLEKDSKGKAVKGTGESSEKLVESFKRSQLVIPEKTKNLIDKSEYKALEADLKRAYEDDIRQVVNKEFDAIIEALSGYKDQLRLIEFTPELCAKIDKIFGAIKRKARASLKQIKDNSESSRHYRS